MFDTLPKFFSGRFPCEANAQLLPSKENLDYALRILVGGDMEFLDAEGDKDSVGKYRSARSGPAPMIMTAASEDEEFAVAAGLINVWLEEAERGAEEGTHKEVRVGVM